MRTAHAEWWPAEYESGETYWWRYGTADDALTIHEQAPEPGHDPEHGIVIAGSVSDAIRIDAETWGAR